MSKEEINTLLVEINNLSIDMINYISRYFDDNQNTKLISCANKSHKALNNYLNCK